MPDSLAGAAKNAKLAHNSSHNIRAVAAPAGPAATNSGESVSVGHSNNASSA
ncbi:MAG TPA: hypothetical protein VGH89_15800 [Pseudonocardia sp.]